MDRVYLLSVVLLSVLTQCRECANSPPPESDRAALERADRAIGKTGAPSYELFTATIEELRNRFGDVAADSRIDALLTREPGYAPAHLARAESLFRHGRIEAAIVQGNLALKYSGSTYSGSTASARQLRAIHSVLDKARVLESFTRPAR
jgi:hypothetical protein